MKLSTQDIESLGYRIAPDPQQPGLFLWRCAANGSDTSFPTKCAAEIDATIDAHKSHDLHRCGNCNKLHKSEELEEIRDFWSRVTPGEPMPSGECVECHSLCLPVEPPTTATFNSFQLTVLESYNAGDHLVFHPADVEDCGDSLLKFLLVELSSSEDCENSGSAIKRLETAAAQIQEVLTRMELEAISPKSMYVCTSCGSPRVYSDAFVGLNDESDVKTYDSKHCENCEGECSTKSVEVPPGFDMGVDFYNQH